MDPTNNPAPSSTPPAGDNTPPAAPPAGDPTPPPAGDPTPPVVPPTTPPATTPPATTPPVDPNAPPADPTPPVDPNAPPVDPNAPPAGDDDDDPDADTVASAFGEQETDTIGEQINKTIQANGGNLPMGVNPNGTVDPLVYAYENAPAITVVGKEGRSGEWKEYVVKSAEELPDNFVHKSAKTQAQFSTELNNTISQAQRLYQEAMDHNTNRTQYLERGQQAVARKTEIEALQTAGKLPAFTVKPGEAGFKDSPAAQRAQQVLDFMNTKNAEFKEQGINQEITSIGVALMLLEADEAAGKTQNKMGAMESHRNDINGSISGGGTPPAGTPNNSQRIHRDVDAAVQAGLNRAGGK